MFTEWLKEQNLHNYKFNLNLIPKCEDRTFWESVYDENIIKLAEDNFNYDWPITRATYFMEYLKSGNRIIMETVSREKRNILEYFVLAELMENKGKYLPQIVDGIFTICEETYWGYSAHWPTTGPKNIPDVKYPNLDLFAAETGNNLAWIYYLLNSKLKEFCPEILERIEYEIDRRIIQSYLVHADNWWRGYNRRINNWNPWIISNVLNIVLLMIKDEKIFYECLERMLVEIDFYYKGIPNDGGCDEGAVYYTRAGASLCEFIYLLKEATNGQINFFNDEKIINIATYPYKVYIGNGLFVNFSDGSPAGCRNDYTIIYIIGKEIDDSRLLYLAYELFNYPRNYYISQDLRRELLELKYRKELQKLKKVEIENNTNYLCDTQVFTQRKDKWFFGIKGGHNNECHNHNDVGSYVLAYDKKLVIIDCGVGVYSKKTFSEERYTIWTMQSSYHNLPDINSCAEHDGINYKADSFIYNLDHVQIELKSAYTSDAKINGFNRIASLENKGLLIEDKFSFIEDKNFIEEHLMTIYKPHIINEKEVTIGDFVVKFNVGTLSIDEIDITYDANLYSIWKQDCLYRINLKAENENTISYIIERK